MLATILGGSFARADSPCTEISLRWFSDGANHWRKLKNADRVIQPLADQPSYRPEQVSEIAANVLLFQRDNGGWPKDYDLTAILTPEQGAQVSATRGRDDTSFDNHNIFSQVEYLAHAHACLKNTVLRDACQRGLEFMLAAQYVNGGFPQSHPGAKGYHAHITFNDGAMIGVLRVLRDVARAEPHFAWLDDDFRSRAADAVARGTKCVLGCQIVVDGARVGWCQQHDRETFAPMPARTFELASICPQDTTEIVRYLMDEPTTPETAAAIEGAVEWLRRVQLSGVRALRVPAAVEEYPAHTVDFDVVVVDDPGAPPLWARHYEIGTNRPVFAGRDAVKRYRLAEIERERRTGTPWYGTWPAKLLEEELPAWRAKP